MLCLAARNLSIRHGVPTTVGNGKKERQAFHYSLPLLESTRRRGLSSLSQYKNTPQEEQQSNSEVASSERVSNARDSSCSRYLLVRNEQEAPADWQC